MVETKKTKPVKTKMAIPEIEEIADLRSKGVSLAQIARMRGVSRQAISQAIKRHGIDAGEVENFRNTRPAILAAKQRLLLDGITKETVKKMSGRDKLVGFGILYDKERLELGQSTANIASIHSIAERVIRAVQIHKSTDSELPESDKGDAEPVPGIPVND